MISKKLVHSQPIGKNIDFVVFFFSGTNFIPPETADNLSTLFL